MKLVFILLLKNSKQSRIIIKSVKRCTDVKNTEMMNHKIRRNRNRNILVILALFTCMISHTSCNDNEEDGFRGFMSKATIIGDSINGYYCYLDGGGLVISHDRALAGVERGYFGFHYKESDWTTSADGVKFIDNAHVSGWSVYDIIQPISKAEAEAKHITDKDRCQLPSFLSVDRVYRGYFDLNLGTSIINRENGEKIRAELNMVYDPEEQIPDTLRLQLCYNPRIPDNWSITSNDYGTVSCDISSLVNLQQWSDSVTVVVKSGDKEKHGFKISKNDFIKHDVKITFRYIE